MNPVTTNIRMIRAPQLSITDWKVQVSGHYALLSPIFSVLCSDTNEEVPLQLIQSPWKIWMIPVYKR